MEDRIIKIFRRIVKKELKNNLIKIILFGSRARGDNSKYSDYDFIIVVKTCSRDIKDKINYIEGEMLYRKNAVISAFVFSELDFEQKRYEPFIINALKEGIYI